MNKSIYFLQTKEISIFDSKYIYDLPQIDVRIVYNLLQIEYYNIM